MAWRTITLDNNGGSGTSPTTLYLNSSTLAWATQKSTASAYNIGTLVSRPTRQGYSFAGFFTGKNCDGTQFISSAGVLYSNSDPGGNKTLYAGWRLPTAYTLTFDYNGGSGPTQSKTVMSGLAIGELPTATRDNATFLKWMIDGETVTSATVWKWNENKVATAVWESRLDNPIDYFGLRSNVLTPIASDSGDNRQRICVSHTGKFEKGVDNVSGTWRNPRVTYIVRQSGTVSVTLGKAYAAKRSGNTGTVSGYMITSITVETRVGQFPTVTVEAVANEGANAINTWPVSIAVIARSKAQNLLNGVSGGGMLNACTVVACCDPVVIEEDLMPCASDVVHGRIELSATTIATAKEGEPTAAGGFTSLGAQKAWADASYTTYKLNARKDL